MQHRSKRLKHQLGKENKLDIAKSSGVSRGAVKFSLDLRKAKKHDWKTSFKELNQTRAIINGVYKFELNLTDEFHNLSDD